MNFVYGKNLKIYPNPAKNYIKISSDNFNTSKLVVSIVDLTGREVFINTGMSVRNKNVIDLDISGISSGTYILQIRSNNTQTSGIIQIVK